MKTFVITIICLLYAVTITAQTEYRRSELLFDGFTQGMVLFKNKTTAKAPFNYDMFKGEMLFMDGENKMILQNPHTIDTIYIDERKFIPYKNAYLEKVDTESNILLIEWVVVISNELIEGKGLISHGGGTDVLNISRSQTTGEAASAENIESSFKNNNTYYLLSGKKMQKFNTIQGLAKLYPKESANEIQKFASDNKINIQKPEDLNSLIGFADKLKN